MALKDWQHPHMKVPGSAPKLHTMTIEEEQATRVALHEKVHYTYDGVTCTDCGVVLTIPPATPFPQDIAVVMIDGNPRAAWVTTMRKPNCMKG